jgi:hypothetical protein
MQQLAPPVPMQCGLLLCLCLARAAHASDWFAPTNSKQRVPPKERGRGIEPVSVSPRACRSLRIATQPMAAIAWCLPT